MITLDQVTVSFPGSQRAAVDNVSLTINAGQFVVLLGPSGCGKTTLLKTINRLYEPSAGRVLIDGADATAIEPTILRRKIGYVIQQSGLFPHMRIRQNIGIVPELLGWERARIDARVSELLALVGLPPEYANRLPRQLSGGEQQRVGVARALAADPAVVLMDEPFGAIDAITRDRLQGELQSIQRRLNKTIVFVTHDVEEALRLADRIVIMRSGTIVRDGAPLAILADPGSPFVADLIGSDDVLRRLSLVVAANVMGPPLPGATQPPLEHTTDLRRALGRLLSEGTPALPVTEQGTIVGSLGIAEIRAGLQYQA